MATINESIWARIIHYYDNEITNFGLVTRSAHYLRLHIEAHAQTEFILILVHITAPTFFIQRCVGCEVHE